jgi:hypothetical protein
MMGGEPKGDNMAQTQTLQKRTFDAPDEVRPAGSGKADVVVLGDATFMRAVLPPGWKWSKDVNPVVNTGSCQAPHLGFVVSGRLMIQMDDGTKEEFGPGDLFHVSPGHDAWVVGDEPFVQVDIAASQRWAKSG